MSNKNNIVIEMTDGEVSLISAPPDATIEIRDYDVPDDWDPTDQECDYDSQGDRYQRVMLQGEPVGPIKGRLVEEVTVTDLDRKLPIDVEIIQLETGGMIGVDSSYLEQEAGPVYSPFDAGVEVKIEE